MAVKTFTKTANGEENITPNFKIKEFACKDGSNTILIDVDFVKNYLQKIRDFFGKAVIIISAYRTPQWNRKVNGSPNSFHLQGRAFDIAITGVTPKQIAICSESLGIKGIIQYNNFVHIDSRPNKYFAEDNNGKVTIKETFGGRVAPASK